MNKLKILLAMLFAVGWMAPAQSKAGGYDIDVGISEPSDRMVWDGYGNAYVIFGGDSSEFSFDCTANQTNSDDYGNLMYSWEFSGGSPAATDDSGDSGAGPISFENGGSATVYVWDDTCGYGEDTITVSKITFTFQKQSSTSSPSEVSDCITYIPDEAEYDENGNVEVRCDFVISADSGLTNANLGTLSTGNSEEYFIDGDGNVVTEVVLDDSGSVCLTLITRSDLIVNGFSIAIN